MPRIAVGGFQHETNTFAPIKADWARFVHGGSYPGAAQGAALFDAVAGSPQPIAGGIEALRAAGAALVPLAYGAATPSAHVTDDAFERLAGGMLRALREAGPVDGVYLDLHGAAVTESLPDAEGELLARVRAQVGPATPIAASLDLHANITARMVATADLLDAFRTYPHVDMAETGARAASALLALVARPTPWHRAFRRVDFLIPLNWMCTLTEPARALYAEVAAAAVPDRLVPQLSLGFPLADIPECGPSLTVYGRDAGEIEAEADRLLDLLAAREADFAGQLYEPDAAVAEAHRLALDASRPVVLSDTQDNPGGGGPGDTVGLLRALADGRAGEGLDGRVVLGLLIDPEAAAEAHAAGEGAALTLDLGGKSGMPGHAPLRADCVVERLGDGRFTGTGPMYGGTRYDMGPMARLRIGPANAGVRCLVASRPSQAADQAQFRHLGVEPAEQRILALKSSVHFRADFQPIAETVLVVVAPGPVTADLDRLTFQRLRPGVRRMPKAAIAAPQI